MPFPKDDDGLIEMIESNERIVDISARLSLATARYRRARKSLHIGIFKFESDYISVMLPKKSPLLPAFNLV